MCAPWKASARWIGSSSTLLEQLEQRREQREQRAAARAGSAEGDAESDAEGGSEREAEIDDGASWENDSESEGEPWEFPVLPPRDDPDPVAKLQAGSSTLSLSAREVHVEYRGLGWQGGAWGEEVTEDGFAIVLTENKLGLYGARRLARALATNTTLKELFLDGNNIRRGGARAIAQALSTNNTLQLFKMTNENVRAAGARALAAVLRNSNALRTLDLSNNNIGADGAVALGAAIRANHTLEKLYLNNNQIGARGATALAAGLGPNRTLKRLEVSYWDFGDEGVQEFVTALETNRTITFLRINRIDDIHDALEGVIADRLRLNQLAEQVPAWVEATAGKRTTLPGRCELPLAFATLVGFLAFGDALVPADGWQSEDGRAFATQYLSPLATSSLRATLSRLAAGAAAGVPA